MAYNTSRLPSRFPVGTKFVIEGRRGGEGKVYSRYLEFPDGTFFPLPAHPVQRKSGMTRRSVKGGRRATEPLTERTGLAKSANGRLRVQLRRAQKRGPQGPRE